MTRSFFRFLPLAALLCAALAPAAAHAQLQNKVGGVTPIDALTAQEQDMLALGQDFAKKCGETLEKWLASKEVSEEKLFANLYYPIAKTDPPKFTTDYDRLADRDLPAILEGFLAKSPLLIYAVLLDKHGYLPTHNTRYSQPLTGNRANDLVNNRTKRIFNDRTGYAAARNKAPFLIQRYQRDTGEVMADLSVPVMVKGQHWGVIRLGYRAVDGHAVVPATAKR
jgi:methyl-accepting chemotaxis protein